MSMPTRRALRLVIRNRDQHLQRLLPPGAQVRLAGRAPCDVQLSGVVGAVRVERVEGADAVRLFNESAQELTLDEVPLEPGMSGKLGPGSTALWGPARLVLENGVMAAPAQRRICTHSYFETRLEEECFRAAQQSTSFAIVAVAIAPGPSPKQIEEQLANVLRVLDVVCSWGERRYELLLFDANPEQARMICARIVTALSTLGAIPKLGLACFPIDGDDPHLLIEKASATLVEGAVARVEETRLTGMGQINALIQRIAPTPLSVLLQGETGVGKEVVARAIHKLSVRAHKPMVNLIIAAMPETLLESELFGYEKGAFTGATQAKTGLLEVADGGTVYLDEIGEMPLSSQVKLLRVLESREVVPVGGTKPRPVDVRIISATNRDLEQEVERGQFRADLMFRINAVTIRIPPLRERLDEFDEIARRLVEESALRMSREPAQLTAAALQLLRAYPWPGNVRELKNTLERAVVLSKTPTIDVESFDEEKFQNRFAVRRGGPGPRPLVAAAATQSPLLPSGSAEQLRQQANDAEKQAAIEALEACAGNQTAAAKMLGITRRTLIVRIRKYGLPRPRSAEASEPEIDAPSKT